jgi:hypothetical protein
VLARQVLHELSRTSSNFFALVMFWIGSCAFIQSRPGSHNWDHIHLTPCPPCWLGWGLANFLPMLVLNCDTHDLCLPSTWDYRYEPPQSLIFYSKLCFR